MEEEQIDELSKKTLGSYIKKASHDAAHKSANVGKMALQSRTKDDEMDFVGGRKDNAAAEKSFRKSWKRREGIAKAVDKLTKEDFSLESIQEEIRNNLLERANSLLEHGSQEQIVEFMNDLTMEQRSILNLQEQVSGADIGVLKLNRPPSRQDPIRIPTDPGNFKLNTSAPRVVSPGPPPPAPRSGPPARDMAMNNIVPPGDSGLRSQNDDLSLGNGIVKGVTDWWKSRHDANSERVNNANAKMSNGGLIRQNNDAELATASITGAPSPGSGVVPRPRSIEAGAQNPQPPTAKPAAAQTAAKPDISSGDESAGLNMNRPNYGPNKPAAPQQSSVKPRPAPSSVSTADTGDKYGSGNASAGFERGKYAAPAASDNSSASNELRSKQAAADRGNLGESKTVYMSESTLIRNLLRNR
jgi:hypothetical protein